MSTVGICLLKYLSLSLVYDHDQKDGHEYCQNHFTNSKHTFLLGIHNNILICIFYPLTSRLYQERSSRWQVQPPLLLNRIALVSIKIMSTCNLETLLQRNKVQKFLKCHLTSTHISCRIGVLDPLSNAIDMKQYLPIS